ncbi:MAG: hypothetical protein LBU92_01650 [Prevotellaceae bacterium]|nr:hypothetical protein [Prevotellaceae bacterium]
MNWKRYPLRAAKYVLYFYFFALCMLEAMHLFNGNAFTTTPDFSTFFTPRLLIGLALLGVCYPLVGFNSVSILLPEGGWEVHGKSLHEAMSLCRFKFVKNENGKLIFCAESPARRALTMFEDKVTLEISSENCLIISGLRKDVALIRLRVNDYLRRI